MNFINDVLSLHLKNIIIMFAVLSANDCGDLQDIANFTNGVYTIHPPGLPPTKVWCDKDEDGLMWTVG